MLFIYKNQKRKLSLIVAYILGFFAITTAAFAVNGTNANGPLTAKQITAIIKKTGADNTFNITATPDVVDEINRIRGSQQAREQMRAAMERMQGYKAAIVREFKINAIPEDFLALPLVESGYKPLDASLNKVRAAGIWQIIPLTAGRFGLVIDKNRDDRLNTELSTRAAINYLKTMQAQFNDWNLTVLGYEIGEDEVSRQISKSGSHNIWDLTKSPSTYPDAKKFVAMLSAAVIIMHQPSIID